MQWLGAIVACLGLLFSIAALIRSSGEDVGGRKVWKETVDKILTRHSEQHEAHFQHQRDMELHWTPRERDLLQKQLDRIEELIIEGLTPRGQWRFRDRKPPEDDKS